LYTLSILLRSRIISTNVHTIWKDFTRCCSTTNKLISLQNSTLLSTSTTNINCTTNTTTSTNTTSSTSIDSLLQTPNISWLSTWFSSDVAVSSTCLHLFILFIQNNKVNVSDLHALCIDSIRIHNMASILILLQTFTNEYFYKNNTTNDDIWPIKEAVHCIFTIYMIDFSCNILDSLNYANDTSHNRMLSILSKSLEQVSNYLYNVCGWSSSLIGGIDDDNESDGISDGGAVKEEEEFVQTTKMCVGYIFWDHPQLMVKKKIWNGRKRYDIQHDAWCALELLSCTLPEFVFEILIEKCIWNKYIEKPQNVGNGSGSGSGGSSSCSSSSSSSSSSSDGSDVDIKVYGAALALCGRIGKIALDHSWNNDETINAGELDNITNPFICTDENARKRIVLQALKLVQKLRSYQTSEIYDNTYKRIAKKVIGLLQQNNV
jgi:hypothetical protein